MNKILAICIPTHNRAAKLEDALKTLLPIIDRFDIGVYISDNASEDNTAYIVSQYQQYTKNIFYHKNDVNLGWIRNFEDVIRMADSHYSWLCGDDDLIVADAIEDILQLLSGNVLDLMIVNGGKKRKDADCYLCNVKDINSHLYSDRDSILADLGPYMSWMSGLIFSHSFMRKFSLENYAWSPFAHMVAIFDTLTKQNSAKVYFKADPCVYVNRINSTGDDYTPKVLEYFSKDWLKIEHFLTGYSPEARGAFLYGYRDHIVAFGFLKFVLLRMEGNYNYQVYKNLKDDLKYITCLNNRTLLGIALFVPVLPKVFVDILKCLRAKISKWI